MIFTRPAHRKIAAPSGPITIDDVRDGAPASWAGPANPGTVMLFDSSGLDWMHATDYQTTVFNDANFKTGTDGGLDLPQGTPSAGNFSRATTSGLMLNPAHSAGVSWSWLMLFSYLETIGAFEFLLKYGPNTTDRMGYDGSAVNFRMFASTSYEWNYLPKSNVPYKAAIGIRYDSDDAFATRGKLYGDGAVMPQASRFISAANYLDLIGVDNPDFGGFKGTMHAFFRWDYEITEQEMLDATADPDSLFAAA